MPCEKSGEEPSIYPSVDSFSTESLPFQTLPANRFICSGEELPLRSKSSGTSVPSTRIRGESVIAFQASSDRRANQSRYTLECLHRSCRLPQIPNDLHFGSRPLDSETQVWRALESSFRNALLRIWVGFLPDCVSFSHSTQVLEY